MLLSLKPLTIARGVLIQTNHRALRRFAHELNNGCFQPHAAQCWELAPSLKYHPISTLTHPPFLMLGGVYPFKLVLCDTIDTSNNDRFWCILPSGLFFPCSNGAM